MIRTLLRDRYKRLDKKFSDILHMEILNKIHERLDNESRRQFFSELKIPLMVFFWNTSPIDTTEIPS